MHKFFVLFLILLFSSSEAKDLGKQGEEEAKAVQIVSQLMERSQSPEMDVVWPGLDLPNFPLLVTFNNGHVYAFNLKSELGIWTKKEQNGQTVLSSDQDHWGLSQSVMLPHVAIEGQDAFAFNLENHYPEPEKIFEILVHERFHRHQFSHFQNEGSQDQYGDQLNGDNLTFMQIEEVLLVRFLGEKRKEIRAEILKDFAAIHIFRRQLISPSSRRVEDHQQTMEGLAEYVSFKMFDVFPIFKGYSGRHRIAQLVSAYARNLNVSERALKWRYYGVGAAMGYALDFMKVKDWKKEIEKGKTLSELLERGVKLSGEEIMERVQRILVMSNFFSLRGKIQQTLDKYQQDLKTHQKNYRDLKGIPLQVGHPQGSPVSGGGETAQTLTLADGSTISLEDSSIMSAKDETWQLELQDVPFVFQNNRGEREFKVEEELIVYLDRQPRKLSEIVKNKGRHPFQTIEFQGKSSRFFARNLPGYLVVQSDGKVLIQFN